MGGTKQCVFENALGDIQLSSIQRPSEFSRNGIHKEGRH